MHHHLRPQAAEAEAPRAGCLTDEFMRIPAPTAADFSSHTQFLSPTLRVGGMLAPFARLERGVLRSGMRYARACDGAHERGTSAQHKALRGSSVHIHKEVEAPAVCCRYARGGGVR